MFATSLQSREISTPDFAGRWYFCDDGWLGTLNLKTTGEHDLVGTFTSNRFDEDYRVTAHAGLAEEPHTILFDIHDFNWMPVQHYAGHLFTRTRGMISGSSRWEDQPFGFFATRSLRPPLGTYRAGPVCGEDFAGSWTAHLDGEPATVVLRFDPEFGVLRGSCKSEAGDYDVTGKLDGEVPHQISLTLRAVDGGLVVATLAGYLMSRPKNAISGAMSIAGVRLGFVMVRYA
jgi:hypothetical protein